MTWECDISKRTSGIGQRGGKNKRTLYFRFFIRALTTVHGIGIRTNSIFCAHYPFRFVQFFVHWAEFTKFEHICEQTCLQQRNLANTTKTNNNRVISSVNSLLFYVILCCSTLQCCCKNELNNNLRGFWCIFLQWNLFRNLFIEIFSNKFVPFFFVWTNIWTKICSKKCSNER